MRIQAYFEEWSVLPGDTVRMAISTPHDQLTATLEKITSGPNQGGDFAHRVPGLDTVVPGGLQSTAIGSFADLPLDADVSSDFAVHIRLWPTVADWSDTQTLWSLNDFGIALCENRLRVLDGDRHIDLDLRVESSTWYSLLVQVRRVEHASVVDVRLLRTSGLPDLAAHQSATTELSSIIGGTTLLLAASGIDSQGSPWHAYNGKLETPALYRRLLNEHEIETVHSGVNSPPPDLLWDFTRDMVEDNIFEISERTPAGAVHNGAERAVTGHNWTGAVDDFTVAPEQYGAIQFHADDMIDANWSYSLEFTLPEDLDSGVYAVRLEAGDDTDHYPLFVRSSTPHADVLLLFPTNTYLAYGNDRFASGDLTDLMGHEQVVSADEQYLNAHPEFGKSCYDVHTDGTPVRYSSRRRPLVNVRPQYPNWLTGSYRHLAVDLLLLEWLDRSPFTYHVATDEDVHLSGGKLLSGYKVVVTGSHPEYWTDVALTALEDRLKSGGKLMYLGGNGFYWVTTHDPARPWRVEIRRDNSALRAWDAPVGERNHVHTGEPGGIWRFRGRSPNRIAGVAFATEGWSQAQGFVRTPASYSAAMKRFFVGIEEEKIGDFGYILGGAAGDECDRFNLSYGSPSQTVVLASATGFGPEYVCVNEEVLIPRPNQDGPHLPDVVRADMVYIPIHGGGEVFSASSIAYAGAIAWNDFDNNIATLTGNVLASFIETANNSHREEVDQ